MDIDLENLTIEKAHKHMKSGDFSAVDLSRAYLNEIEKKDKELNAYLEVYNDVLDQAKEADRRFKNGVADVLTGIPIAVKDIILVKGKVSSAGSKILENYKASYDATGIRKLREKGIVFLGRTNCDEFAMGASTENSAYGVTRNPHDTSRVAGGSSGGSIVAVAANMALAALGTDTGGSIRQPSALCGTVGLKPTYGAVSRYGLISLASSLDTLAPVAKNVRDVEIVFEAIRGQDIKDSTTLPDGLYEVKNEGKIKSVGVPMSFLEGSGLSGEVLNNFKSSLTKLEKKGYKIENIELPHVKYSVPVYYIILPAEASANLARFDGVKYGLHKDGDDLIGDYLATRGSGFGAEPRRRIILGTYVLSSGYYDSYYNKAGSVRRLITQDFEKAFKKVDLVAMPTAPGPAFKVGEKSADPVQMYLQDIFTAPANLTGLPAISVPSGCLEEEGKRLPLGIEFYAPHMNENLLVGMGKKFEQIEK